jgi:fatty-acyl-CoA synthase
VTFAPAGGLAEEDQTGELLVRGLNVFGRYWNRPADTSAAFSSGWFRSGDIIHIDDSGWAYVVGRIKDMIISGGENIYPAEVEAALNLLPGIFESAVVAVPDARWGEVGAAFIVGSGGHDWNPVTIREALAPKLASYKIPKYVQHVPSLPKTATGKVRKRDLSQLIKETADDHHR